MLFPRNLKTNILRAAADTPVVMLNGSRQTGKSTLMMGLFSDNKPRYVTLDDMTALSLARSGPQSFIEALPERVILDEIQRVPELLLPIKLSVDKNRQPGRFFITGSANVINLPKVADSLAGRIEIHTLWPLSQGERLGRREDFIDFLFSDKKLPAIVPATISDVLALAAVGGYPDVQRRTPARRSDWFQSYISTLMDRDVRDLSNIEQLTAMPNLLALIASRSGGMLNSTDLSRSLSLPLSTLKRYLSLLELLFLVVQLPPWFGNIGKRLVKMPKLYMNDTGLLCHLLGCDAHAVSENGNLLGMVVENFIVMELIKQLSWCETRAKIFHFRTVSGQEVDIVLEAADGRIVGIECKGGSSIKADAFNGLKVLKEVAGKRFHRGIVLYTGAQVLGVETDMQAIPVSSLWEISDEPAPALSK